MEAQREQGRSADNPPGLGLPGYTQSHCNSSVMATSTSQSERNGQWQSVPKVSHAVGEHLLGNINKNDNYDLTYIFNENAFSVCMWLGTH